MSTTTMYPPGRKKPGGENRRARPAKKNEPRTTAASAPQGSGFNSTILFAALAVGAGLAWFKSHAATSSGESGSGANSNGDASSGFPGGASTGAGGSSSGLPAAPPKTKRPAIVRGQPGFSAVFVNSFNGEPIYEKLRQVGLFPDGYGLPSTLITRVGDQQLLGARTGKRFQPTMASPAMIQIYARAMDGFEMNFWIEEDQTVSLTEAEYRAAVANNSKTNMSNNTLAEIKKYFANRYIL